MNRNRLFKDAVYEQFARMGKGLSSPKRLELLDLLCQGPRTVEILAGEACITVGNASRHLQILRSGGLVESSKNGLYVTYRIADETVCDFFRNLRFLAEARLAEVGRITRRFMGNREGLEPVDRGALLKRVRSGKAMVIDVRPREEYRAGHIPGAVSVPLKELESRLSDLPTDQEIVAYCRGPYCILAIEAVEKLRARGYRAVLLGEGVHEWRALGFAVETAAED